MKTVTTAKSLQQGELFASETRAYLDWEDAFDAEFDDGLSFLEPTSLRPCEQAEKISAESNADRVSVPRNSAHIQHRYARPDCRISWSFIRELRRKIQKMSRLSDAYKSIIEDLRLE